MNVEEQLKYLKEEIPLLWKKVDKIEKDEPISNDKLILEMLRFLNLIHQSKQTLSPSLLVDYAWHEFILFTRVYQQFCDTNFHRFIHHTPSEKSDGNLYLQTIKMYILVYGNPDENIWGKSAKQLGESASCGACKN